MILLLLACTKDPASVAVRTTLGSDRDEDPSGVASGAVIDVYDASTEEFSHATADDDGAVTLSLPWGHASFVVLHADGHVPTSFALGAFYLVIEFGGWQHALAALAGFALARLLLVRHLSVTS